jgi:4-hydroxybenzoate polyprenyltransferase
MRRHRPIPFGGSPIKKAFALLLALVLTASGAALVLAAFAIEDVAAARFAYEANLARAGA